jgi:hypothetical protein
LRNLKKILKTDWLSHDIFFIFLESFFCLDIYKMLGGLDLFEPNDLSIEFIDKDPIKEYTFFLEEKLFFIGNCEEEDYFLKKIISDKEYLFSSVLCLVFLFDNFKNQSKAEIDFFLKSLDLNEASDLSKSLNLNKTLNLKKDLFKPKDLNIGENFISHDLCVFCYQEVLKNYRLLEIFLKKVFMQNPCLRYLCLNGGAIYFEFALFLKKKLSLYHDKLYFVQQVYSII